MPVLIPINRSLIGLKDKVHFYFGEDAVPADKLSHLLKSTKTDVKEAIAWSHQTGKGLLYFAKHPDQKSSPKGVIALVRSIEACRSTLSV